jgi:hypothetical protein
MRLTVGVFGSQIAKYLPLPCVGGMVCTVAARLVKIGEFKHMWHGDKVCAGWCLRLLLPVICAVLVRTYTSGRAAVG